jgi:hypothetical protein
MKRINYGRVLLGGILAGVLLFMADGFIHEKLLHEHWMAAMKAAGRSVEAEEHGSDMLYFAAFELLRGVAIAWIYAVMRAQCGPGPKTAICATLAVWAIMFPIFFLQEVPLGFYSTTLLTLWSLYEIVPSVIAGLVAGALYKDPPAAV